MGNFRFVAVWITKTERPISNYGASSTLLQLNKVGGADVRWQRLGKESSVVTKARSQANLAEQTCEHLHARNPLSVLREHSCSEREG